MLNNLIGLFIKYTVYEFMIMKLNQKNTSWQQLFLRLLSSNKFYWLIIVFFVFQASWIALTGLYPMAFDEDFHLGIIRLYAHHISPFWSSQPDGANAFGAVYRDPSYLYHYLMSFPYRLISNFTSDVTAQVLMLRAINIGLFTSGLMLFRRVLSFASSSKALVNACLLGLTLIPVIPLLAAQINYDSLMFPLTALLLLLTLRVNQILVTKKIIAVNHLLLIGSVGLLASLVKYAFLPIFAVVFVYLLVRFRQILSSWSQVWFNLGKSLPKLNNIKTWFMIVLFVLSFGLFLQRYGVNVALYRTPVPDCGKVLSVEACSSYGPWQRDYRYSQSKVNSTVSPIVFTGDWLHGMWQRLFFSVDGPTTHNQTRSPMLLPIVASVIVSSFGIVLLLKYGKRILKAYDASVLALFVAVSGVYIGVLWFDQYLAFIRTGRAVAINGRYLLPVLLLLLLMLGLAYQQWLIKRSNLKAVILVVIFICLLWGGGALTYILRSNDRWYWPNSTVRTINHSVQSVLGPVTPGL